jgi:hypothetical protein
MLRLVLLPLYTNEKVASELIHVEAELKRDLDLFLYRRLLWLDLI